MFRLFERKLYILAVLGVLVESQQKVTWQSYRLPDDFLVGFATSSYQFEGAWNEDGKGESVWDRLTHRHPELIADQTNGDITTDQYHLFRQDIQLMKALGSQIYRFSLSWSRIFPDIQKWKINQLGIDYYNNLIDNLLENGMQPMVTLFHWDLPQELQDLGGWPNPVMIDIFTDYAETVFSLFGDRVKYWITFNEPLETCHMHYGGDDGAPMLNMSGIADYLCAHTIIQAHASVYHLYNNTFKAKQDGKVGITLNGNWNEPRTNSTADKTAAETMTLFQIGWFADPIFGSGDYPTVMRENIDKNSAAQKRRSRLPTFTLQQIQHNKGTFDFYGMNHYTTQLASTADRPKSDRASWLDDTGVKVEFDPSWPSGASPWLKVVPWGFRRLLNFVKDRYGPINIFVTENGYSDDGSTNDTARISSYHDYIEELMKAMFEDECHVVGYTAWSIMDNFEWRAGYREHFGVVAVNFSDPKRQRTLKKSALYLQRIYTTRVLPDTLDF